MASSFEMGIVAAVKSLGGLHARSRPYEPDEPRDEEHRPFIDNELTPTTPIFIQIKRWRLTKAVIRLHWLCFFFGIGASVWG